MRAIGINHVSISATDLEESTRFYEELFGMERIATPIFETSVQWLRVGDLQLHLFLDESGSAPSRHHLGLDDRRLRQPPTRRFAHAPTREWGAQLVELPSGQVQLYFRDPAGNLIELNWPDASTLDRSRYPELRVLADHMPQTPESERAVLYLDRSLV